MIIYATDLLYNIEKRVGEDFRHFFMIIGFLSVKDYIIIFKGIMMCPALSGTL